jgi:methionine sulfoxide reductase heme-binding subunit
MTANTLDPAQHIWWLASRASGLVALALISASVMLGLAMANRLLRGRAVASLHEQLSLAGLVAVAAHGLTLLGDPWLHPGLRGIAVPFAMSYRTVFTGLGIIGGYLAAALGLSFYIRRRIGARVWRRLHRFTPVAYALALAHTVGAGTDAGTPWLRTFMLVTAAPIGLMLMMRLRGRRRARRARAPTPINRRALAPGEMP